MKYRTPLSERMQQAERYRSCPDFRLRKVNYGRGKRGLPLLSSIEEIEAAKVEARAKAVEQCRELGRRA